MNSYTAASVQAGAPVAAGDLGNVGPQNVKSFDLGYRINGKKTALDINAITLSGITLFLLLMLLLRFTEVLLT